MFTQKFIFLLVTILLLLTVISLTTLFGIPTEVQAHPLAGFTPTPEPNPPSAPPIAPPEDDDDDDDNAPPDKPTDYVVVIIDRCDLSCSANFGQQDGLEFEPLASISDQAQSGSMMIPVNQTEAELEMLAHVQLVHDGSGFIVEGTISNLKPTRFPVPYPGRWQVFLMAPPDIISNQPIDNPQLNVAVAASFKGEPTLIGSVEANTETPQYVKCPVACVTEPPVLLPETGLLVPRHIYLIAALIISGVLAVAFGLNLVLPGLLDFFEQ